jgi:hypothetical protein
MRVEPAPRLEVNQSASGQEENLNQAQQRAPNLTACNVVMKEFVDCLGKWDHWYADNDNKGLFSVGAPPASTTQPIIKIIFQTMWV